ncbi:uncharacterized protein N7443_008143 [Penicillium atrosanguineum]|uniref:uncharacterized protein n=1 Tax=Penicillium atrosanguineum TaxID=1132637 RepID=UPI00238C8BEA|nr:uncharacterized protein N7443_008143 [Penicillium atrosanguineum]KAJ5297250.1 hypothetical protein N7443_008143 [Penicillium atrosanguineum]
MAAASCCDRPLGYTLRGFSTGMNVSRSFVEKGALTCAPRDALKPTMRISPVFFPRDDGLVQPQCGPCAKGQRPCVYGSQDPSRSCPSTINASQSPDNDQVAIHEPLRVLVDACDQEQPLHDVESHNRRLPAITRSEKANVASPFLTSSQSAYGYAPSPGTESSVSTRVAPLSWFELLAQDAANADDRFLLSPPRQFPQSQVKEEDPQNSSNLQPRNPRERESFYAAAFRRDPEAEERLVSQTTTDNTICDDPSSWTTDAPITLSNLEHRLFTHFVRVSSQWLDFYDQVKHFSSVVPHLALRNLGLMRALLALSARHMSLDLDGSEGFEKYTVDRNLAVQYYFETLHYLNKAMRHPSYARSHEVIATSILISTYEMIDGSNQDWERHLKGVFWIQRFQDNDGESGGLRQAVWWAWLRQDVWVAMRERRRVFSFWQPKKPLSILTSSELASRATFLLAQCVNYASKEEQDTSDLSRRLGRGSELLYLLQEWYDHLPSEYNSLPIVSHTDTFPPIWVHPSPYAAALQIYSLARILVILNRPSTGGFEDYRAAQKLLTMSVNTICGIARTIDEQDHPASIVSLQCLFGAGISEYTGP